MQNQFQKYQPMQMCTVRLNFIRNQMRQFKIPWQLLIKTVRSAAFLNCKLKLSIYHLAWLHHTPVYFRSVFFFVNSLCKPVHVLYFWCFASSTLLKIRAFLYAQCASWGSFCRVEEKWFSVQNNIGEWKSIVSMYQFIVELNVYIYVLIQMHLLSFQLHLHCQHFNRHNLWSISV